jgi:hypothetical protein
MIKTIHFSLSISLSIYHLSISIYLSFYFFYQCSFFVLLFFSSPPLSSATFSFLCLHVSTGKPYGRGKLSTFDLLVLTSLNQLLYKLKKIFTFLQKTSYLNEEGNLTEPFPSVRIPWSLPIASGYSNVLVVPSSLSIQTYTHLALLLKTA